MQHRAGLSAAGREVERMEASRNTLTYRTGVTEPGELRANLAAMLGAAVQTKRSSEYDDLFLAGVFGCGGRI